MKCRLRPSGPSMPIRAPRRPRLLPAGIAGWPSCDGGAAPCRRAAGSECRPSARSRARARPRRRSRSRARGRRRAPRRRGNVFSRCQPAGGVAGSASPTCHVAARERPDRAERFELAIVEILRLETGGHLHRDHRQELEHVVLEHVLEGAGSVVVAGPALERERATGPRLRCCCSPGDSCTTRAVQ